LPVNQHSDTPTVAKTRTQLNRRLAEGQKLPWPPFGRQWYAGCTTLIIGNSAKAGIRTLSYDEEEDSGGIKTVREADVCLLPSGFVAFDQYKKLLADADGKMSGPRTVLAGFGAGVTESLLAVTPTESIKTTLCATPLSTFPPYPFDFPPPRTPT
jgi:solute carrier family 25 citrate transporter 1